MIRHLRFIALLGLALLLGACSSMGSKSGSGADVVDQSSGAAAGSAAGGVQTSGVDLSGPFSAKLVTDPNSPLYKRVIYFDFDSSEVKPEGQQIIATHAKYLAAHPDVVVTLAGYTDERGSPEYNIGLGDRRARSVARLMELQGVSAKQLHIVSYGEEHPAALGHDEAAWALNRRVEIDYPGQ